MYVQVKLKTLAEILYLVSSAVIEMVPMHCLFSQFSL